MSLNDRQLDLPSSISHQKVRVAASEYQRLAAQHQDEQVKLAGLEDARHAAEDADRRSLAEAIRANKADPGSKAVEAANTAILTTRRRLDALEVAVESSRTDMILAVKTAEATWRASLAKDLDKARAELKDAVDAVAKAHADLAEKMATSRWLDTFLVEPSRAGFLPSKYISSLPGLHAINGDQQSVASVLTALASLADEPKPRTVPAIQPLQRVA